MEVMIQLPTVEGFWELIAEEEDEEKKRQEEEERKRNDEKEEKTDVGESPDTVSEVSRNSGNSRIPTSVISAELIVGQELSATVASVTAAGKAPDSISSKKENEEGEEESLEEEEEEEPEEDAASKSFKLRRILIELGVFKKEKKTTKASESESFPPHPPPLPPPVRLAVDSLEANQRELIAEYLEEICDQLEIPVETQIEAGFPVLNLVTALEEGAPIVVDEGVAVDAEVSRKRMIDEEMERKKRRRRRRPTKKIRERKSQSGF